MAHLHNPKGHKDGWYANLAKDADGAPREVRCGFIVFKAGAVRMVTARERIKCGNGFELSVANGNISGPHDSKSEAEGVLGGKAPAPAKEKSAPKPEPAVEETPPPAAEPDPPADPDATVEMSGGVMDPTDEGAAVVTSEGGDEPRKSRRKRRKKSTEE